MSTFIAILLVALTTYATRLLGYVLLKNKTLSKRQRKILEVIPGCVLISMITPYFLRDDPADLIAIYNSDTNRCITLWHAADHFN